MGVVVVWLSLGFVVADGDNSILISAGYNVLIIACYIYASYCSENSFLKTLERLIFS